MLSFSVISRRYSDAAIPVPQFTKLYITLLPHGLGIATAPEYQLLAMTETYLSFGMTRHVYPTLLRHPE